MKLTITGKVETIIGIMRRLDICDAKFNINEGFSVNLDDAPEISKSIDYASTDEEKISAPKSKGRKRKDQGDSCEAARIKYPHIKTGINPNTITTF